MADSPVTQVDVLVAGAGPAGAALAIALKNALANAGPIDVLLVECAPPAARFGETLPGAASALLRRLGVFDAFERAGHPQSLGQASVWGSSHLDWRDAFTDPQGPGWRLDRERFDAALVDAAVSRGCRLLRPATVLDLQRDDNAAWPWRVRLGAGSAPARDVQCRFVVDATGRRAALARRLGVARERSDALVCDGLVVPQTDANDLDGFALVEAVRHGWFYSARLAGGERLIAWHGDFDLAPHGAQENASLLAAAARTQAVSRFVNVAAPVRRIARVAAWSARSAASTGPGWAAVGDAACCFDPLSSQGLFNALYGGVRLGAAVAAWLGTGAEAPLTGYAHEIDAVWSAYRAHHRRYHASEPRWADQPFWQRRTQRG